MNLHCPPYAAISDIGIDMNLKNTFTIHYTSRKPMNTHVLNRDGEITKKLCHPSRLEIVLGEGGDGGGGFGEGAGAGAGFVGKQIVGELAGELALSMLKLQDTFFDGVLGHHLIHVDVFGLADTMYY